MRRTLSQARTRVPIFSMHEDAIFAKRALERAPLATYGRQARRMPWWKWCIGGGGKNNPSAEIAHTPALRISPSMSPRRMAWWRVNSSVAQLAEGKSVREIVQHGPPPEDHFNHDSAIKQESRGRHRHPAVKKAAKWGGTRRVSSAAA